MTSEGQRLDWVPLESNPEVMNQWASSMGLSTDIFAYHDVFGLDDELLSMVPAPAQAVLLLFPISGATEERRYKEDENMREGEGDGKDGVMWFKQTIGNACGTIGLLHSIANSSAREVVARGSPMEQLLQETQDKNPLERAKLLTTSSALSAAHAASASGGQTAAPAPDTNVDLHFVCFVRGKSGRLLELDGRRRGVVDRGEVQGGQEGLLKAVAQFVQSSYMADSENVNFNLIALAPSVND